MLFTSKEALQDQRDDETDGCAQRGKDNGFHYVVHAHLADEAEQCAASGADAKL